MSGQEGTACTGVCHTGENTQPPRGAAGNSERLGVGRGGKVGAGRHELSPTGDGSQGKSLSPRKVTRDQLRLAYKMAQSGRGTEEGQNSVDPEAGKHFKNRKIWTLHSPAPLQIRN